MTAAPNAWQIEKCLSIAHATLGRLLTGEDDQPTDAAELLALLASEGADIAKIMRRLLLAATEARSNAKAVKERMDHLHERLDRFKRHEAACRDIALSIMTTLPELFPDGLVKFPEVDARVGMTKPGVVVTDADKLEDRFVAITRTPVMAKINEAVADGEVIEGIERRNGAPMITIRSH